MDHVPAVLTHGCWMTNTEMSGDEASRHLEAAPLPSAAGFSTPTKVLPSVK